MAKKIVIAGSRTYTRFTEAEEFISICLSELADKDFIILSGGAQGADAIGERFAEKNGFPIEKYPADWKRYGKAAGPKRNCAMAENCDLVICFWDQHSKGTKSMIQMAKKYKKPIKIKIIEP